MSIERVVIKNLRTGTFHLGWEGAVITQCSSGRSRFILRKATSKEIETVGKEKLCEKCFPNGRIEL